MIFFVVLFFDLCTLFDLVLFFVFVFASVWTLFDVCLFCLCFVFVFALFCFVFFFFFVLVVLLNAISSTLSSVTSIALQTLVFAAGQGDGHGRGLDQLARPGEKTKKQLPNPRKRQMASNAYNVV